MRKKPVIISYLANRLPSSPAKRIMLSRETIRVLTSKELSQIAAGNCPTDLSSETRIDPGA